MAKAVARTVEVEKVVTVTAKEVTLTLSEEEAETLLAVLRSIGGLSKPRKILTDRADSPLFALSSALGKNTDLRSGNRFSSLMIPDDVKVVDAAW